jgi:hypothetical protein
MERWPLGAEVSARVGCVGAWGSLDVTPSVSRLVAGDALAVGWQQLQLPDPWVNVEKTLVAIKPTL